MRTFIAVEIDQPTKQKITELIASLKKSDADVKWASEEQMHLTLKFLGDIEQNKAREISGVLKSIANNFSAFEIQISKIGGFPNLNRPRVLWLGIEKGADFLKILNERVESELEKLNFKKEEREFKVHLTLGRVRSAKNIQNLTKLLKETDFSLQNEIYINEIVLFQSTLTPKGPIYTKLQIAKFLKT